MTLTWTKRCGKQTLDELSNRWTWLDEECEPSKHLIAKRQGDKVRLIDDCTVGGFNSTCGVSERLRVHAIDEMASYIAWWPDYVV